MGVGMGNSSKEVSEAKAGKINVNCKMQSEKCKMIILKNNSLTLHFAF
ncbi:MAG: hypothetical protein AABZ28_00040 [Nitrospinota bacterium]|jgi:hypothetical protein